MALDEKGMNNLKRQAIYHRDTLNYLHWGRWRQIYTTFHFYSRSLFLLPYWLFVTCVRLLTNDSGKRWGITFSRTLLKHYFLNKGLESVWVNTASPLPFKKATLVLAIRDDPMSAHYIQSIFSGTLIIPLLDYMKKFGTLPTPFRTLSHYLSACSYVDQPLPVACENVKKLLKQGYPTLAFINQNFAHSLLKNKLEVYPELLSLTQIPDVDVYLLSTAGVTNIQHSTRLNPSYVTNKLYTLDEVLSGNDLNSILGVNRLGEFFGFRYVEIIKP